MGTKLEVTKDSIIGDVIRDIPGADKVIQKYFGNGCFTCPGINMETISFGATMHNTDPEKVVEDLKKLENE
jgi:hybrid cluster-associated redox disulfide protein